MLIILNGLPAWPEKRILEGQFLFRVVRKYSFSCRNSWSFFFETIEQRRERLGFSERFFNDFHLNIYCYCLLNQLKKELILERRWAFAPVDQLILYHQRNHSFAESCVDLFMRKILSQKHFDSLNSLWSFCSLVLLPFLNQLPERSRQLIAK